jgi:hypothetical protein
MATVQLLESDHFVSVEIGDNVESHYLVRKQIDKRDSEEKREKL